MLSPIVRILDLDASVTSQPNLMAALGSRAEVLDLRALGPSLRYLCGRAAVRELERALAREPAARNQLTFIGSGDFHHVTASLLRQFSQPLTVVFFDRHADFDRRPPWPCCGSWVAEAVALPHVVRVIAVGLGKEDIGGWRIMLGRIPDLLSGKIVFFPYDCRESSYVFGKIRWRTIEGSCWRDLTDEIITMITTDDVYLSIDKDCLDADEAFTNWEPGHLRVDDLVAFVARLAQARNVAGADITGEYSPISLRNYFFRAIAMADHPAKPVFEAADLSRNEATNLALLRALLSSASG